MLTGQEPANDVPEQFLWPKITKLSSSYKLIQNQTTQKIKIGSSISDICSFKRCNTKSKI